MKITLERSKGIELNKNTYIELPTPPGIFDTLMHVGTLGFCPKVPDGYVECVSAFDPRRICPRVRTCPGGFRGLISEKELSKLYNKLKEKELEKIMSKAEAEALIETQKVAKLKEEMKKGNHIKTITDFILSPVGIALIGGAALILILLLKKK